MLDLRRLRNEPDAVKEALARRNIDLSDVDRVIELDAQVRRIAIERDEARKAIKTLSKQVGGLRRDGKVEEAEAVQVESRTLGDEEKRLAARAEEIDDEITTLLLGIPNEPADDTPTGASESDNVVIKVVGFDPDGYAARQRVPHWETGAALGILDVERATKMSGAMFTMLRGDGARLSRALIQYALDRNSDAFEEIRPPSLVLTETLQATGQLPKFADDAYRIERDDLWAIPTAEVPLTFLGSGEVAEADDLPARYTAHTSCYRREAGSAGRDTRGMLRTHEFDKVEILAYCTPEQALDVHADLLARAERSLAELGLAYRVVDLCDADLTFASRRCFDLEAYAPGCDQWLECSSISWFGDFQARRANLRYRQDGVKGTSLVHTLNGSALAVPRVWAAIVETHRREDGRIDVPEVLQPYLGGATILGRTASA